MFFPQILIRFAVTHFYGRSKNLKNKYLDLKISLFASLFICLLFVCISNHYLSSGLSKTRLQNLAVVELIYVLLKDILSI